MILVKSYSENRAALPDLLAKPQQSQHSSFFASMRHCCVRAQACFPALPQVPTAFAAFLPLPWDCMATDTELSDFLAGIEKRAFKQAVYAVRKDESALDIVQDAMIKLVTSYAERPAKELPALFQRILQNTILDYFRREKVRNTWVSLFSSMRPSNTDDSDFDLLEVLTAQAGSEAAASSEDEVARQQTLAAIETAVAQLPARQREAFLLRYWLEMDVAETAAAMGCSAGSVKTHCSRATRALAELLKARGISL